MRSCHSNILFREVRERLLGVHAVTPFETFDACPDVTDRLGVLDLINEFLIRFGVKDNKFRLTVNRKDQRPSRFPQLFEMFGCVSFKVG